MSLPTDTAIFAAGCFWGVEDAFMKLPGVVSTEVGYTGGRTPNPTYEAVCSGVSGHAEAVKVTFKPVVIPYAKLVHAFFQMHDPTQFNRQGPDIGDQYRSAIFVLSAEQQKEAERIRAELDASTQFGRPIVTQIVPAKEFYRAEDYHQQYLQKNAGKDSSI